MTFDSDLDDDNEWVEDDGDSEDDLLACPACREAVHEDTQKCPYCGEWIIPVDPRSRRQRWLFGAAAIAVIAAILLLTFS